MSNLLRSTVTSLPKKLVLLKPAGALTPSKALTRTVTTNSSGAFLPEPTRDSLGLFGISGTVTIGLFLGAAISKHIASFLEENELFVPADDDDDD